MVPEAEGARARRPLSQRWWVRLTIASFAVLVVAGIVAGTLLATDRGRGAPADAQDAPGPADTTTRPRAPSTTSAAPTTTTIPALTQPAPVALPPVPGGTLARGAEGPEIAAYEQRLADLHFDPGAIDASFDQALRYAVEAVEKLQGWPRDGIIDQAFVDVLATFRYPEPLVPQPEPDRVEIDLDRQLLTVYRQWQVALVTTTSTGNGRRFCGGADGCQYAVTPTGRYEFQWHVNGWRDGDLGRLYNPWYFNGGIAVHGYTSVPTQPASHGCARIPMHVSEHFGDFVAKGMPVYVLGTEAPRTGTAAPPAPAPTAPRPAPAPTTTPPPPPPPPPTAPTTTVAPATSTTTAPTSTTVAPSTTTPVPPPGP
jgi:hypothetical protein